MGFPRQMAHGMWTFARTLAALGRASLAPSSSQRLVHLGRCSCRAPSSSSSTATTVGVTAGLRSAKGPTTTHLVLTLEG